MKVNSVEFVKSAIKPEQWPKDALPAVAFAGRSNVGKSSLINNLLNRRNVMRVSRTPGRTQLLNFVLLNKKMYVVDLPGYGYAKVPMSLKKQWGPMIGRYIAEADSLAAVVHILDIRHPPTKDDIALLDWLQELEKPTILVLTKADKLSNNQIAKSRKVMSDTLDLPTDAFTIYSSETGRGRDELWSRIDLAVEELRARKAEVAAPQAE